MLSSIKGIIFDLDNTLLRSSIDFSAMKRDTAELLIGAGCIGKDVDPSLHTTSTLIELARAHKRFTERIDRQVWETVAEHEQRGMREAEMESGAEALLKKLHGKMKLTLLTNNAYSAALTALHAHDIKRYFDLVVAREQAVQLKPSSMGVRHVLRKYPHLPPAFWVSVGDSWIDGKAAAAAGVAFVAYRANEEDLVKNEIKPVAAIDRLSQLPALLWMD